MSHKRDRLFGVVLLIGIIFFGFAKLSAGQAASLTGPTPVAKQAAAATAYVHAGKLLDVRAGKMLDDQIIVIRGSASSELYPAASCRFRPARG
jgi:hypothetical protein